MFSFFKPAAATTSPTRESSTGQHPGSYEPSRMSSQHTQHYQQHPEETQYPHESGLAADTPSSFAFISAAGNESTTATAPAPAQETEESSSGFSFFNMGTSEVEESSNSGFSFMSSSATPVTSPEHQVLVVVVYLCVSTCLFACLVLWFVRCSG
jgi:hypothetical protein